MIWSLLIIAAWVAMALAAFSDVLAAAYRRYNSRKGHQ